MKAEKVDWATKQVLECAGIPVGTATEREIACARRALDECYYIDRATDQLLATLDAPRKPLWGWW